MGSVRCCLVAATAFALVVTGCGAPSGPSTGPSVRKRVNCTSPDGWRVVGIKKFSSGTEVLGSSLVCITAKNSSDPGHTYRVSLLSSESVTMSVTVTERSGGSVISEKRFQWTGAEKSLGPYDTARAGVVYSFRAKTGSYETDTFSLSANGLR